MGEIKPRLILLQSEPAGADALTTASEHLNAIFDVIEIRSNPEFIERLKQARPEDLVGLIKSATDTNSHIALESIGEGVVSVTASGDRQWTNRHFDQLDESLQTRATQECGLAAIYFSKDPQASKNETPRRRSTRFTLTDRHWAMTLAPLQDGGAVGILWDMTEKENLQRRLDSINAAGSALMQIDSKAIVNLHVTERLKLLEERIVKSVHDLLDFDNFEIRLLNQKTKQLELVIAINITPLKVGEVIYAKNEGNGISGYVAASGESYICSNVQEDALYREGLDSAKSSLTVPLKLLDTVIGVFNAESYKPGAFNENDRQMAEMFCQHIASAMHILDLLLVERFTTNEQTAQRVLSQLEAPIDDLNMHTEALTGLTIENQKANDAIKGIMKATALIKSRLEAAEHGPRTVLDAEDERQRLEVDPTIQDKRILIADDEPAIRTAVCKVLEQQGCQVTVCGDGNETLKALEIASRADVFFDLVISDIKMPDCSGYDVFQATHQVCADTPVILMTGFGYDPDHSIVRASQEGLGGFLFKPFNRSQLLEAVSRALAQSESDSTH